MPSLTLKMKLEVKFLLFIGLFEFSTGFTSDQFQTTQVRQWTEWYNTDTPTEGVGDDEGVANIRQRGYDVCRGNTPINAVCRVARQHSIVFDESTSQFTDDVLMIPCNEYGIICRNVDQINRTCLDYEIRFECLEEEFKESTSVAVIGIAAGMSITIPILCVIIMHIVRLVKRRRNGDNGGDHVTGTGNGNDRSSQTDRRDLPPSYSDIFGENTGSHDHLIIDDVSVDNVTLVNESGVVNAGQTSMTSSTNTDPTGIYTIVPRSSVSDQRTSVSSVDDHSNNSNNQSAFSRLRFPGLHLSIFEMFSSSVNSNSTSSSAPTSPDLSYIQTPPPTYVDAVKILEEEKNRKQTNVDDANIAKSNEQERL